METFKAYAILSIVIVGSAFIGYTAVKSVTPPKVISENEVVVSPSLGQTEIPSSEDNILVSNDAVNQAGVIPEEEPEEETEPVVAPSGEHATLIAELQKLVDDVVYMKVGSRGTRVGTIQKFLNVYNNTTGGVDNDYGEGTKTKVIAFQKAVKISADGETGPQTYQKMIDWLKTGN